MASQEFPEWWDTAHVSILNEATAASQSLRQLLADASQDAVAVQSVDRLERYVTHLDHRQNRRRCQASLFQSVPTTVLVLTLVHEPYS